MTGTRNPNGEGSIAQRADGRWQARFSYVDPDTGERSRRYAYGATKAEAARKIREERKRVEAGRPARDSSMTLAAWTERWLATVLPTRPVKASTVEVYASRARRYLIDGTLGARPLARIRPTDVRGLLLAMGEAGSSASTRRQVYAVLSLVLDAAVDDRLIGENPAAKVDRPRADRIEAAAYSDEEVRALLDGTAATRYGTAVAFLALTGMRRGEALALRWEDVDLDAGRVYVRGTLSRVDRVLDARAPKTARSRRGLDLSPAAVAVLREQQARQGLDRQRPGWTASGYVFTAREGGPLEPRNVLRALTTAAERAGIEGAKVHRLRHTGASMMLGAGVPVHEVSALLGHSSAKMTLDTYAHMIPGTRATGLDALAARLA